MPIGRPSSRAQRRAADSASRSLTVITPEILRRVRLDDAMKAKKLRQALHELAEEGVVQLFRPHDGSPPIVGVVGTLLLDVLAHRGAMADDLDGDPVFLATSAYTMRRTTEQQPELTFRDIKQIGLAA